MPDEPDPSFAPLYSRVMLKISGEALMGDQGYGLHPPTVERIAREVKSVHDLGVEICMVIGGGNIFRGLQGSAQGMERTTADYMGMLATVMNALAMQSALEGIGVFTRVISAITMNEVAEPYIRRRAVRHLEKKRVCIFAAGTGNPFFTTDTAATLRANEMNCEAIFKGTKVDGVYDKDPKKHPDAKRYETVTYDEVLSQHLGVMDASAIALARENDLPIIVFSLGRAGWVQRHPCRAGHLHPRVLSDASPAAFRFWKLDATQAMTATKGPNEGQSPMAEDDLDIDLDDLTRRMEGALAALRTEFASLRTGRASASMLEPVMVDAYGSPTPINQVGTVNVPESRMVTINVWDKALVGKVEKAIRESGLGINPQLNGTIIMLPIPELNEERRTQLTKVAAQYAEHARVAIRNVRRDGMDQIKKAKGKGMSEDDQKLWEGEVQELTDAHIAKVDAALEAKQGEIMQV